MAQELVGIRRPQRGEQGLDGNRTLTAISFTLFLWSIPIYRHATTLAAGSETRVGGRLEEGRERDGKGLGVGLETVIESLALDRFYAHRDSTKCFTAFHTGLYFCSSSEVNLHIFRWSANIGAAGNSVGRFRIAESFSTT